MSSLDPKLFRRLQIALLKERAAYVAREDSPGAEDYRASQAKLLDVVKAVGREGSIEAIIAAEKSILINERQFYGDSAGMRGSLDTALKDIADLEKHVVTMRTPKAYATLAGHFGHPRNQRSGLPLDGARKAIAAHDTRLLNSDKSRLTETERRTLDVRRANLRIAEKAYVAMQRQALGVPSPAPKKSRGRSL